MKMVFTTLTFVLSFFPVAFAAPAPEDLKKAVESQLHCGNFIRNDDQNVYLGFGTDAMSFVGTTGDLTPAKLTVVPLLNPADAYNLTLNDSALDLVSDGQKIYVLTFSALEIWDLASHQRLGSYPTQRLGRGMDYKENPTGLIKFQDKLVISHGRLGLTIFDLKQNAVVNEVHLLQSQAPKEGMATAITAVGNRAYIAMDNFTLGSQPWQASGFHGVVTFDLTTMKVIDEVDGLDIGADDLATDGNKLFVSFGGLTIWKYLLSGISGAKLPRVERRVYQFPDGGHPVGRPVMDAENFYTCFIQKTAPNASGYKIIPRAFSRQSIKLD